ncbi:MAG: hypothetical protein LBS01_03290 [Prevotellaceae bacterium]|jgi:tetratricopeptide (TPR) repeat protein|nr:hypothetical protein [Prevotellaceae bacterium]
MKIKTLHYSLLIVTVLLFCCTNKTVNKKELSVILNDSAISLYYHSDDFTNVIILLDSAIKLNPKYYTAYWNLIAIQNSAGKKSEAFKTVKKMSDNFPLNPDILSLKGIYYEIFGDSINAVLSYQKADKRYKYLLDSLTVESKSYQSVVMNYALNLKLLHEEDKANETLFELRQKIDDEIVKQAIDSFYINKKREDLFEMYK